MIYYIICYDIWFYISHVFLHYHPIHKIHHAKPYQSITWMDAHKAHVVENVVQHLGLLVPELSVKKLLLAYLFICIRGMMRHDDRCSWLTGNHHLLHHKHPRYNFGEYWLDKLCGTLYPNKSEYVYGKFMYVF